MGIVKLNLAKTLEATAGRGVFMDVPKDGEVRVRLLPPMSENDGSIWFLSDNHFRHKSEDGRGIAIACNNRHGDGDCFICKVVDALKGSKDASEQAMVKGKASIRANRNWYFQVLVVNKDENGEFVAGKDIKLLRLPKTGADAVNDILRAQQKNDDASSCGPEAAQDIVVRRRDTGVPVTKYSALPAGKPKSLDDYLPEWEGKYFDFEAVWKNIALRLMTNEEQREAFVRTYPAVDLDELGL